MPLILPFLLAALAAGFCLSLGEPAAAQQPPGAAPLFKDERRLPGTPKQNRRESIEEGSSGAVGLAPQREPNVQQLTIEPEDVRRPEGEPPADSERIPRKDAGRFADDAPEQPRQTTETAVSRRAESARRLAAEAEAETRRKAHEDARRIQSRRKGHVRSRADTDAKRKAAAQEANRRADEEAQQLAAELDARREAAIESHRLRAAEKRPQPPEEKPRDEIPKSTVRETGEHQAHRFARTSVGELADEPRRAAAPVEQDVDARPRPRRMPARSSVPQKASEHARFARQKRATAPGAAADRQKEADRFVVRGQQLLSTGNVAGARIAFQRAAQAGSAAGALELGATYDPAALQQLGAVRASPDKAAARRWYTRARQLGDPSAADLLQGLDRR